MDNVEAQAILDERLAVYGARAFVDLVPLAKASVVETCEVLGSNGTVYQVEVQFVWDGQAGGPIRVLGAIDDGGIRAFFPMGRSIVVLPTPTRDMCRGE